MLRGRGAAVWLAAACLPCIPVSLAANAAPDDFEDLKDISSFGAISVSVHRTNPDGNRQSGLAPDELAQYVHQQVSNYFPDVPYVSAPSSGASEPHSARSVGRLSCRIWIHDRDAPAVFQVKCQISSAARLNIVEDGSFGYGPTEKASEIVLGQIDHILRGFAALFARAKEG